MQVNLVSLSKDPELKLRANKRRLGSWEQEIVRLVVQGYGNSDIARILSTNELTIDNDLHNILEKLALSNRLELALYAIHSQMINQPDPRHPGGLLSHFWLAGCLRKAWVRLRRKQGEI